MKKRWVVRIIMALGIVPLLVWSIVAAFGGIAYGLDSGDALGGAIKLVSPVLVWLAYMLMVSVVARRLDKADSGSPSERDSA